MVHLLCTDWVARFELWTIADEPLCVADGSIPLDPDEIHLQFQHSMWQEDPSYTAGHWRIQFPTAISPQNRLVCIIRTVYYFTITKRNEAQLHAVQLPLHLHPHGKSVWPKPLETSQDEQLERGEQRRPTAGNKKSFSDFLKPSWGHRRSKSLPREASAALDIKRSGSIGSRMWSRSSPRRRSQHDRTAPSTNELYRHWITFTRHGTLLLLLDYLHDDTQPTIRFPSNLVLYKIDATEDLKVSTVVSTRMTLCSAAEIGPPKVLCHPSEPVLAVFFPQAGGGSPVITWQFDEGSPNLTSLLV
jgi:hypothetical protein